MDASQDIFRAYDIRGVYGTELDAEIGEQVGLVLVKEGIPFVPSFLIAYVVSWIYGNLLFVVFG